MHLLHGHIGLFLDVGNGLGGLIGIVGQADEHGAEGFSVDVFGVRPQDVHLHPAVNGQRGNEGLIGGAAVEGDAHHPAGFYRVQDDAVGVDQLASSLRLGVGENLLHRAGFHHLAVVQNGHMGADLLHHRHLVCNDNDGDTQTLVDVLNEAQNAAGGGGV